MTTCRNPCIASRLERHLNGDKPILLNLYECDVVDEDLRDLSSDDRVATRLRTLNLIENPAGRWLCGLPALGRCSVLKVLKLHCCRIGEVPGKMAEFATGVEACGSLRALGLGHNGLTAAMLKTALTRARHITVLHLPANELGDAAELADALAPLTELAYLDLSCNDVSDTEALSRGLRRFKQLTQLRLYGCPNIGDIMPFGQLLPENGGNLQSLDVRGCGVWQDGSLQNRASVGSPVSPSIATRLTELTAQWNHAGPP
jgi:hypothetical protein